MRTASLFCLAFLAAPCLAADPPQSSDAQAIERATTLRREAAELRARAERDETLRKPECDRAFQVNRCLQEAREARLVDVRKARNLEHQAHQLELGVKRRQAASAPHAEPVRPHETKTPAPPLRIRMRNGPNGSARDPADAAGARQTHEARLAAARHQEEAAAARRAAQARADRTRYDARQRAYEEKQAGKE